MTAAPSIGVPELAGLAGIYIGRDDVLEAAVSHLDAAGALSWEGIPCCGGIDRSPGCGR